jgi:hypothetical protein
MAPRQLLSPQSRAALFDPPTDPAAIVRHYTFSPDDLALIRQRRRDANRLGFAVHLAYLRFQIAWKMTEAMSRSRNITQSGNCGFSARPFE